MKQELKYIELKTGYSDDGPAWIGYVEYSKSGKTVYFNDKAFGGNGHGGCSDIETGEIYWITGIKRNGSNRHQFGGGAIQIDETAINEYELLTGINVIQNKNFKIIKTKPTDKKRFERLLNDTL
jgi:hypothetical protein